MKDKTKTRIQKILEQKILELEARLGFVECLIAKADTKDLPYLNGTYQKLMGRIVELDLQLARRFAKE